MTDRARARFKALVDSWRIQSDGTLDLERGRLLNRCADDLSALLVQEAPHAQWCISRTTNNPCDCQLGSGASAPKVVQEAPQEEDTLKSSERLRELVEEFTGWWELNREGSVNRSYDYIDKMVKRLRAAAEAPPSAALLFPAAPQEKK